MKSQISALGELHACGHLSGITFLIQNNKKREKEIACYLFVLSDQGQPFYSKAIWTLVAWGTVYDIPEVVNALSSCLKKRKETFTGVQIENLKLKFPYMFFFLSIRNAYVRQCDNVILCPRIERLKRGGGINTKNSHCFLLFSCIHYSSHMFKGFDL
jgi:hypothetical protein